MRKKLDANQIAVVYYSLESSGAIVFGAPTYTGSLAAPLKIFMEATSNLFARCAWQDKLAGGFTNSGSFSGDKLNGLLQLAVFAAQHVMLWVPQTAMSSGKGPDDMNRLGGYPGVMAQSDNDGADVTPPAGDKDTAFAYGKRVDLGGEFLTQSPGLKTSPCGKCQTARGQTRTINFIEYILLSVDHPI